MYWQIFYSSADVRWYEVGERVHTSTRCSLLSCASACASLGWVCIVGMEVGEITSESNTSESKASDRTPSLLILWHLIGVGQVACSFVFVLIQAARPKP